MEIDNVIENNLLMAIKPYYVELMRGCGKKVKIELNFPQSRIDKVFIYETAPNKIIQSYFVPTKVLRLPPDKLWKEVEDIVGVPYEEFDDYTRWVRLDHKNAVGIFFDELKEIQPITLKELGMRVPSKYLHLSDDKVNFLLANKQKQVSLKQTSLSDKEILKVYLEGRSIYISPKGNIYDTIDKAKEDIEYIY